MWMPGLQTCKYSANYVTAEYKLHLSAQMLLLLARNHCVWVCVSVPSLFYLQFYRFGGRF